MDTLIGFLTWDFALEAFGLVSGLLCVWLLIRQNVLTFPIGLAYAVVSVYVMAQNQLYADVVLNAYYVGINAYGWWYWTQARQSTGAELPVSWTDNRLRLRLLAISIVGIAAFVTVLSRTDADLVFWDSTTTVLSFVGMWMTARKLVENWIVWVVVDVIAAVMYFHKGLYLYSVLYTVYLAMAVMGWRAWRASMAHPEPDQALRT